MSGFNRKFQESSPYNEVIELVLMIPSCHTPTQKLDCLVEITQSIVTCVEKYYKKKNVTKKYVV